MPRTPSIYNPLGITSANTFAGNSRAPAGFSLSPYRYGGRVEGGDLLLTRTERIYGGPDKTKILLRTNIAATLAQSAANQATTEATPYVPESLSGPLQTLAIGDPIQQVWARRRPGGTGGTMVHMRATEARLTNDATTITAAFHLVVSVGQIGPIELRDVRQGTVRQGVITAQNYGERAGLSVPGNYTSQATATGFTLPTLPTVCGGGGNYAELSTVEFTRTYLGASQLQDIFLTVTAFIRNGIIVTRLEDGVTGSTDNVVDVVLWNALRTKRLRQEMIDMDQMEVAAKFIAANGLYLNGVLPGDTNLDDMLTNLLPAFLLRATSVNGKFALSPILPYNEDYTINYGALDPDFVLTEAAIVPGSYQETPAAPEARISPQITVTWRQQTSEVEPPLDRTTTVGAFGEGDPPEQWGLAGVLTDELHAVTAGACRYALRTLSEGVGSAAICHGSYSGHPRLREGAIVQILLHVVTPKNFAGFIKKWWQVTGRTLGPDGTEVYQLEHFPVDSQGRSLVALAVAEARSNVKGVVLPYPVISTGDVAGRAVDTTTSPATTSGAPFSSGGGGATGTATFVGGGGNSGGDGFDETRIPPSPPDNPPIRTDVPGPVVGALDQYGPPTQAIQPKPLDPDPLVWYEMFFKPYDQYEDCYYEAYDAEYELYIEPNGPFTVTDDSEPPQTTGGYDYGISQTIISKKEPLVEIVRRRTWSAGPNLGQEFLDVKITWVNPSTLEPESIYGFVGPNQLEITRNWYRCALQNGEPDEYVYPPEGG